MSGFVQQLRYFPNENVSSGCQSTSPGKVFLGFVLFLAFSRKLLTWTEFMNLHIDCNLQEKITDNLHRT
jgi:hypothetical protein